MHESVGEHSEVGTAVRLHSLVAKPMLNGRHGIIVKAMDTKTGRVGVKLDGEEYATPIALKPTNLSLVMQSDSGVPPTGEIWSRGMRHLHSPLYALYIADRVEYISESFALTASPPPSRGRVRHRCGTSRPPARYAGTEPARRPGAAARPPRDASTRPSPRLARTWCREVSEVLDPSTDDANPAPRRQRAAGDRAASRADVWASLAPGPGRDGRAGGRRGHICYTVPCGAAAARHPTGPLQCTHDTLLGVLSAVGVPHTCRMSQLKVDAMSHATLEHRGRRTH